MGEGVVAGGAVETAVGGSVGVDEAVGVGTAVGNAVVVGVCLVGVGGMAVSLIDPGGVTAVVGEGGRVWQAASSHTIAAKNRERDLFCRRYRAWVWRPTLRLPVIFISQTAQQAGPAQQSDQTAVFIHDRQPLHFVLHHQLERLDRVCLERDSNWRGTH